MITYTVYYKKKDQILFRKIKNVTGDGRLLPPEWPFPVRLVELEDKTRIEIPMEGTVFKFSKERFFSIKDATDQEARQNIQIK